MHIKFKWLAVIECIIILILLGAFMFIYLSSTQIRKIQNALEVKEQNNTRLLSIRVYTGILKPKSLLIVNFEPLREKLVEYISEKNANASISVYVVNLRDGASLSIREKRGFLPASLNKLPVAILMMQKIEKGMLSFDTMLEIKDSDRTNSFGNLYKTKEKKMPLRIVLEKMLKESDNTAFNMLLRSIDDKDLQFLLEYLDYHSQGVILPEQNNKSRDKLEYVSTKSMYNLFSSLYLSTLLKPEDSEYILSLLTDTVFDIKKMAKLPDEVIVAQKFATSDVGDIPYFHSCGILYIAQSRIFYCIMTEGLEPKEATNTIDYSISLIYEYVVDIRADLENYRG